jgi:hypothetical protein
MNACLPFGQWSQAEVLFKRMAMFVSLDKDKLGQ